jgi:hypothetical protein
MLDALVLRDYAPRTQEAYIGVRADRTLTHPAD